MNIEIYLLDNLHRSSRVMIGYNSGGLSGRKRWKGSERFGMRQKGSNIRQINHGPIPGEGQTFKFDLWLFAFRCVCVFLLDGFDSNSF